MVGLPGSQDGELDAVLRQDLQRLQVDGRFRQPHTLRPVPEKRCELLNPPADLGDLVFAGRQRQDGVMIALRHGVPHPEAGVGCPVLLDNQVQRVAVLLRHPAGQGRADVEADTLEIAQLCVGAVAVIVDALVPVAVRSGAGLIGDSPQHGIFTRWLVKMTVDTERFHLLSCLRWDL